MAIPPDTLLPDRNGSGPQSGRRTPTFGLPRTGGSRSTIAVTTGLLEKLGVSHDALSEDGVPVEYAQDRHRGDRARFVVEVAPRG